MIIQYLRKMNDKRDKPFYGEGGGFAFLYQVLEVMEKVDFAILKVEKAPQYFVLQLGTLF